MASSAPLESRPETGTITSCLTFVLEPGTNTRLMLTTNKPSKPSEPGSAYRVTLLFTSS